MTRKKRKVAWGPSNALWRYLHGKRKTSSSHKVKNMARRRYRRSRGGLGMGRLLSMKNILLVAAAAYFAPKVIPQVDPKIVTAAAGYMGAGIVGAAAGYVAAPIISQTLNQATSGMSQNATSGALF